MSEQTAKKRKKLSLTTKIFIGFALGIVVGAIFGERATILDPLGQIFIRLIKMLVVPLVFTSITCGVASLTNMSELRRIGIKTIVYYLVTTAIAFIIGLVVTQIIRPGVGFDISDSLDASYEAIGAPSFWDTILGMIPTNIIESMANGDLLPIIVFGVFLGIALTILGDKASGLKKGLDQFSNAMYKITEIIMGYAPIGVFALMAATIGEYGATAFGSMVKYVLSMYVSLILVFLLMYTLMLKFIAKVPVLTFYKKAVPILLTAASTASSGGTLPVTLDVTEHRLGVPSKLCSFTLPLGATINMHGAVICLAGAVMFVSQAYGLNLSIPTQIQIILVATLLSAGSPAIPGGFIVSSTIMLTVMGLPLNLLGLLSGIDRIVDIGATCTNVTGDVVCTLCVAESEKMIDREVLES
jgi:Na+/H+-dicarboxylate symporter